MRSQAHQARLLPLILASMLLVGALSACATPIVAQRPASGCSGLVPADWRQGVAGADLPAGQTVGEWIAFGDAQTGQLDKANDRTKSSIEIVAKCEARDAAAVRQLTRKWWEVWK